MSLIRKRKKYLLAQGVLEYVLVVGIVVVALIAMTQAIKRGAQSIIKTAADQIGSQENADQGFGNTTGYLDSQNSVSSSDTQKQLIDRIGVINYVLDEQVRSTSNSLTNMGFTEDF